MIRMNSGIKATPGGASLRSAMYYFCRYVFYGHFRRLLARVVYWSPIAELDSLPPGPPRRQAGLPLPKWGLRRRSGRGLRLRYDINARGHPGSGQTGCHDVRLSPKAGPSSANGRSGCSRNVSSRSVPLPFPDQVLHCRKEPDLDGDPTSTRGVRRRLKCPILDCDLAPGVVHGDETMNSN